VSICVDLDNVPAYSHGRINGESSRPFYLNDAVTSMKIYH